jgi:hypothetical protein
LHHHAVRFAFGRLVTQLDIDDQSLGTRLIRARQRKLPGAQQHHGALHHALQDRRRSWLARPCLPALHRAQAVVLVDRKLDANRPDSTSR